MDCALSKKKISVCFKIDKFCQLKTYNFYLFLRNWSSTCFRLLLCVCTLWTWVWNPCWRSCTGKSQSCRVQGCNARKVISEVYASFVLQCTVWAVMIHKTDVTAWHGIHLSHKKSIKYSGHRKLLCELSKLSNVMLLTSSDTKRTLMHLFLFTNTTQRDLF